MAGKVTDLTQVFNKGRRTGVAISPGPIKAPSQGYDDSQHRFSLM